MALSQLNACDEEGFVGRLGMLFEHSPWVAQRAWKRRPFDSIDGLFRAMNG